MQGSLHSVWVLNRAVTVDYIWVKARNGKFSFLLMEKDGKAVTSFSVQKIAFALCFILSFLYLPFSSSELHVE